MTELPWASCALDSIRLTPAADCTTHRYCNRGMPKGHPACGRPDRPLLFADPLVLSALSGTMRR